jgi:hypothetical protein
MRELIDEQDRHLIVHLQQCHDSLLLFSSSSEVP